MFRATVIAASLVAVLLVAAIAYAAGSADDSTSTTSTSAATAAGEQVFRAGEAGEVTVAADSSGLTVDRVDPSAGWAVEVETSAGREVEVKFEDGNRRIDFQAELEDGRIGTRVRTEDRAENDDHEDDEDRTTTFTGAADGETVSFDAEGAGRVQIRRTAGGLELVDATAASGWEVVKIEREAHEIEVEFRQGVVELEFKAELEDGMIRTRTETTIEDGDHGGSGSDGPSDRDDD